MKFLVPNYSCFQNPWLRGYRPQIPVLSVLNWICWTPPPKKISLYATGYGGPSVYACFPAVRAWLTSCIAYSFDSFIFTQTGSRNVVPRGPVARPCAVHYFRSFFSVLDWRGNRSPEYVLLERLPGVWRPCLVSPCTAIQKHALTLSDRNWIVCRPINTD